MPSQRGIGVHRNQVFNQFAPNGGISLNDINLIVKRQVSTNITNSYKNIENKFNDLSYYNSDTLKTFKEDIIENINNIPTNNQGGGQVVVQVVVVILMVILILTIII